MNDLQPRARSGSDSKFANRAIFLQSLFCEKPGLRRIICSKAAPSHGALTVRLRISSSNRRLWPQRTSNVSACQRVVSWHISRPRLSPESSTFWEILNFTSVRSPPHTRYTVVVMVTPL